jgi:hypothetical protein
MPIGLFLQCSEAKSRVGGERYDVDVWETRPRSAVHL